MQVALKQKTKQKNTKKNKKQSETKSAAHTHKKALPFDRTIPTNIRTSFIRNSVMWLLWLQRRRLAIHP